mmetsp:Transcript_48612/g.114082  ORF Transcript_48612/g.114082 Transcript_48612/m.114082 type:complete len:752 (+) Transcript_48612:37-2292(+)
MAERRSPNFETAMGRVVSASSSIAFVAPATYSQDFSHFTQNHLKGSMGSIDDIHEQVLGLVDIRQILGNLQTAVQRMEMCLSHQMVAVEDVRFALGLGTRTADPKMSGEGHQRMGSKSSLKRGGSDGASGHSRERIQQVQPPEIAQEPSEDMPATLPGSVHHSVGPEVGGQSWALPDYAGSRSLVMKSNTRRRKSDSLAAVRATKSNISAAFVTKSMAGGKQFHHHRQQFLRDRRRNSTQYGMMDALEAATARQLQLNTRRKSTARRSMKSSEQHLTSVVRDSETSLVNVSQSKSVKAIIPDPASRPSEEEDEDKVAKFTSDDIFSDSGEVEPGQESDSHPWTSRQRMLKRCRRVSLEELQDNYDADRMQHPRVEISRDLVSPVLSEDDDTSPSVSTALVGFARFLLNLVGILDFGEGLVWQVLSGFSILVPSFVSVGTVALNIIAGDDFRLNTSILCYVVGGLLATLSLRRAGITALLGPVERRFDEYAEEMGFLQDWRKVSLRRFCEVTAMYVFMVSCRVLASVITKEVTYGSAVGGGLATAFPGFTFSLIALTLSLICYCQLHVCCGLELAIDSFGLRLFRDMNMEKALEEWNLVQATLRQTSGKISGSLFILGATSFATLMFLAEQLLNNADLLRNLSTNLVDTCLWLGWLYPPILLFVYSMFRAAAVSEKASRVAPLVNSWKFDPEDLGDAQWMDADRQYVVQYIIQSEAGFYMKGVRLTAGSVQKMSYYMAAFTFSLFARFFADS